MRKEIASSAWLTTALLVGFTVPALAAGDDYAIHGPPARGTTRDVIPQSSIERPGDIGRRAHTNYRIGVPPQRIDGPGRTAPPH